MNLRCSYYCEPKRREEAMAVSLVFGDYDRAESNRQR